MNFFQVLHTVDRHWVFCKTEHREGIVPTSHVTPQDIEDLDENQSIYMAQCNINGSADLVVTKGILKSHSLTARRYFCHGNLSPVIITVPQACQIIHHSANKDAIVVNSTWHCPRLLKMVAMMAKSCSLDVINKF